MPYSTRVVMADDHVRTRARLREYLETGGFDVCGEAADAGGVVALALEHRPEVALIDIHMPGNGIWAAGEISRKAPDTAIVMLTHSRDDADLFDALRAGASGYLLKDTDPDRLPAALRGVLAGEAAIPRTLVARVLEEFRAPARRRFGRTAAAAKLSTREWEVMQLLAQGYTTDEVASRLFLSPTTVRVHVSSVLRKLRVRDRKSAFEMLQEE